MDCNSPAQAATAPHGLKHPCTDRDTPARAETTSLSGRLSHHVLNKPVTSLRGAGGRRVPQLPQGWRESRAGWNGAPRSIPVAIPSARRGKLVSRGRKSPSRLAAVRALLFRPGPRSAAKVSRRKRRKSDLSRRGCKETFLSPALLPPLGAGHPPTPVWTGQNFPVEGSAAIPQSSPRLQPESGGLHPAAMSCPLCSGEQEVTEILGRMR